MMMNGGMITKNHIILIIKNYDKMKNTTYHYRFTLTGESVRFWIDENHYLILDQRCWLCIPKCIKDFYVFEN
jgi:hypothetical protein